MYQLLKRYLILPEFQNFEIMHLYLSKYLTVLSCKLFISNLLDSIQILEILRIIEYNRVQLSPGG